jgi:poly(ADP-ribose) glycohydrolase
MRALIDRVNRKQSDDYVEDDPVPVRGKTKKAPTVRGPNGRTLKAYQRVIWPWETRRWPETRQKILEPMTSIVDMDSRISSIHTGKVRPRIMTELFNRYYDDAAYEKDRVPREFFIKSIIPMLQKLVDNAHRVFAGFSGRLLIPLKNSNLVLTRPQVATIIACIWFGLFDYDYVSKPGESGTKGQVNYKIDSFPEPTFTNGLENQNVAVLQFILSYFARLHIYMNSSRDIVDRFNAGNIIIKRHVISGAPDWTKIDMPLSEVYLGEGHSDDSPAKMNIVFAHDYIGGDMFKGSLTQEEIVLLTRPECIVACLFCAKLEPNETIVIMGAEKMSQYGGYGSNVRFMGNFVDDTRLGYSADETEVMLQSSCVFMDASSKTSGASQYIYEFERDLNKAFCGMTSLMFSKPGVQISTGNWTYGFTGANMQLKFIQQLMAASVSGKCLIYYPQMKDFENRLLPFIDWMMRNELTVGGLYELYLSLMGDVYTGPNSRLNDLDIFECLMDM